MAAATRWWSPTPRSRRRANRCSCKLVESGRIVYRESFEEQAERADRTWGRYKRCELSEKVDGYKRRFETMRRAK